MFLLKILLNQVKFSKKPSDNKIVDIFEEDILL